MVEVLSKEPDPRIAKEVSCGDCGARLRYVPREIKSYHGTDYSGGPDGQEWVDCPNCGGRAVIRSW